MAAEKITIPNGTVVTCVADGRELVLDRESTVVVHTRKLGHVYYMFNAKMYRFAQGNGQKRSLCPA